MAASHATPLYVLTLAMLDEQGGDVHASLIPAITAAMNNIPGGPKTQLSFDEVNEICYEMMTRGDHTYRQNPTFTWWFEYGEHVLIRPEDIIKEPRNAPHHMPEEYMPRMDLSNMRPVEEPTEPPEAKHPLFSDIDYEPSVSCCDESIKDPYAVDVLAELYPPMPSPAAIFGHAASTPAKRLSIPTTKKAKGFALSATASPFVPGGSSYSGSQSPTVSSSSSSLRQAAKAPTSKSQTTSTPPFAVSPPTRPSAGQHTKAPLKQITKEVGKPCGKKADPKSSLVAVPDPNLLFGPNNKSKQSGSSARVSEGLKTAQENHKPATSAPTSGKKTNTDAGPGVERKGRENEIREWVRSLIQKVDTETK